MKYTDLRKKTIFDLDADRAIIDKIVPPEDKDFFIEHVSDIGRAVTFLELAELTNDNDLEKATKEQFIGELSNDE